MRFVIKVIAWMLGVLAVPILSIRAYAQQPQIPTLQVCNGTTVSGGGEVKLPARADAQHAGVFHIELKAGCDVPGYPVGTVALKINMSDSQFAGPVVSTTIDQLTSTGKQTPTAYLSGRCKAEGVDGCRFWLMLADNGDDKRSPDVVGFLILNGQGVRVAYGTGTLSVGSIKVSGGN